VPPPAPARATDEDWSDVAVAPARAAAPPPPPPPPEPELELSVEAVAPPVQPIELPEEPAVEAELAPMHEFVPAAAATGHRPEAPGPAVVPQGASGFTPGGATPADGGEAALRQALSVASREVIERIVWEVVPQLAETIIRENLDRLVKQRQG